MIQAAWLTMFMTTILYNIVYYFILILLAKRRKVLTWN